MRELMTGCFRMVTLPGIIWDVRRPKGFQVWEMGVRNKGDPEWANCNSIEQTAEVDARALISVIPWERSDWLRVDHEHKFLAGTQGEYI